MPTQQQLRRLYAVPHDHEKWFDHKIRVDVTVAIAARYVDLDCVIADLSCGNAEIPRRLGYQAKASQIYLGDYAPGYDITGPIETTVELIEPDSVDLWVARKLLSISTIRTRSWQRSGRRTKRMILSTPDW